MIADGPDDTYRKDFMGDCDKATSEAILDFFYEQVSFFSSSSTIISEYLIQVLTFLIGRLVAVLSTY